MSSGVWIFKNTGVYRNEDKPETVEGGSQQDGNEKRKVLIYKPTGEVMASYGSLERKLLSLGWERYVGTGVNDDIRQFHKPSTVDLISIPEDFSKFTSIYMYDIVAKNNDAFQVMDIK